MTFERAARAFLLTHGSATSLGSPDLDLVRLRRIAKQLIDDSLRACALRFVALADSSLEAAVRGEGTLDPFHYEHLVESLDAFRQLSLAQRARDGAES